VNWSADDASEYVAHGKPGRKPKRGAKSACGGIQTRRGSQMKKKAVSKNERHAHKSREKIEFLIRTSKRNRYRGAPQRNGSLLVGECRKAATSAGKRVLPPKPGEGKKKAWSARFATVITSRVRVNWARGVIPAPATVSSACQEMSEQNHS